MPQTALLNLGLNYEHDSGSDGWKAAYDNNAMLLDAFALGTVIDQRNAEPGAPALSDAYIIGAAATGANWTGHNNELAVWNAATTAWVFAVPVIGWEIWDRLLNVNRRWDGTRWQAIGQVIAQAADITIDGFHMDATIELDTTAAARDVTIQTDAGDLLPIHFAFYVVNNSGTNAVTFTLAGLTTRGIASLAGDRDRLRIVKVAADTWISG